MFGYEQHKFAELLLLFAKYFLLILASHFVKNM
jgi:hypothetical protein